MKKLRDQLPFYPFIRPSTTNYSFNYRVTHPCTHAPSIHPSIQSISSSHLSFPTDTSIQVLVEAIHLHLFPALTFFHPSIHHFWPAVSSSQSWPSARNSLSAPVSVSLVVRSSMSGCTVMHVRLLLSAYQSLRQSFNHFRSPNLSSYQSLSGIAREIACPFSATSPSTSSIRHLVPANSIRLGAHDHVTL